MISQQLKNSILQMVVNGKLVSQEPNDNPKLTVFLSICNVCQLGKRRNQVLVVKS